MRSRATVQPDSPDAIVVWFQSGSRVEVIAFDSLTSHHMRVSSVGPVAWRREHDVLVGTLFGQELDVVDGMTRHPSSTVEMAIPSIAAVQVPLDDTFDYEAADDGGFVFRGEVTAGLRGVSDPSGRVMRMPIEYRFDREMQLLDVTRLQAGDKHVSTVSSTTFGDGWQVATHFGDLPLARIEPADTETFTLTGFRELIGQVRDSLSASSPLQASRDAPRRPPEESSVATKSAVVAGIVVLVALIAMIRQRTRS